jgi:hypothetical protein
VIARLIGLCLLVLAAVPASADVRLEGPTPSFGKGVPGHGIGHLLPRPAGPADLDQSEREPPTDPTFAAGRADTDQPEPAPVPFVAVSLVPARGAAQVASARLLRTPPSHRACAAPPRGPPAG